MSPLKASINGIRYISLNGNVSQINLFGENFNKKIHAVTVPSLEYYQVLIPMDKLVAISQMYPTFPLQMQILAFFCIPL